MAGGALVPFEVSPGRTVMVPDYLVPQPALAMPSVPAPAAGPDERLAEGGFDRSQLSQLKPSITYMGEESKPDAKGVPRVFLPAPDAPPVFVDPGSKPPEVPRVRLPSQNEVRIPSREVLRNERIREEAAAKDRADPAKLKAVPRPDPRRESSVIADTAAELYGQKPAGGGAAKPTDPQNLRPVVAEIKQERVPGQRLLDEQAWRYGFAERPNFPDEIDPDAEQPTWGTEEPIRRPYLTPLERGAKQAGEGARAEFERSEQARQEMAVVQRAALAEQSAAIDSQLATIAERRKKLASLQSLADDRMESAKSMEPRTRAEIWGSQGNVGRGVAILAAVLGGAAQGLRGGPNSAWDMIENWVNETVEDDRYQYERAMQLGQSAKRDWVEAVQLYGDVESAALESKNRKLANVMAMAQQQMTDQQLDATQKERGAAIMAMAEEAYLANKQLLMDSVAGKVTKEEATLRPYGEVLQKATPKPTGGGGGGARSRGAGAAYGMTPEEYSKLSQQQRSLGVKLPNGRFKFARSAEEKKDLQNKMVVAGTMIARLRQLQSLRADKENTIPWTKKRGQIEAIGADLLRLGKSKDAMGTLDKGLIEFSQRQYGKPEEFNIADQTVDGKIAEGISMLEDEVRQVSEYFLDDGAFELTEGGVSPTEVKD